MTRCSVRPVQPSFVSLFLIDFRNCLHPQEIDKWLVTSIPQNEVWLFFLTSTFGSLIQKRREPMAGHTRTAAPRLVSPLDVDGRVRRHPRDTWQVSGSTTRQPRGRKTAVLYRKTRLPRCYELPVDDPRQYQCHGLSLSAVGAGGHGPRCTVSYDTVTSRA